MELGVTKEITLANPNYGDLALADNGQEVVLTDLGLETAQRLWIRLQFFKGEWFLDLDEGTPWYDRIFVKGVSDNVIRAVFGYVISGTQGVAQLVDLSYTRDNALRTMAVTFEAKLDDGSILNSYDFGEFIVRLPDEL